jgi:hypothetical protein
MMSGVWLALLCAILAVWYPANFAAELAKTLPSVSMRGPAAVVELLAHGAVTALCVAAGWSLWNRRPHGPLLARVALVAAAVAAVQALYWSVLPGQTIPGDELPLAVFATGHAAVWLVYLSRSQHVRGIEGRT